MPARASVTLGTRKTSCDVRLIASVCTEALSESRNLTVEGDAAAPEVLELRAAATYQSGNVEMAQRLFQEVRVPAIPALG